MDDPVKREKPEMARIMVLGDTLRTETGDVMFFEDNAFWCLSKDQKKRPPTELNWRQEYSIIKSLKPCPFCGGFVALEEDEKGCTILCYECHIGLRDNDWTASYATKLWNLRVRDESK